MPSSILALIVICTPLLLVADEAKQVPSSPATWSGDFAGYEAALTRVSTTCSNCHSDFKND